MSASPIVEQIKDRIDLVALVGRKVKLKKSGQTAWLGLCPFHSEKSGSFYVYTDSNRYVCFGCGEKGDCFDWMEKIEGLSFPEALQTLGDEAGVEVPKQDKPVEVPEKAEQRTLLEKVAKVYEQTLLSRQGEQALKYLDFRGIDRASQEEFGIGYAPLGPSWLVDKAKDVPALVRAGVALASKRDESRFIDRFRNRVIFPLHDELGQLVGFSGRILSDTKPKYLNSPQTVIFDKGAIVYNIHRAKKEVRRKGEILIFEGYTDVILAHQHGIKHAVATMGTAMTEKQAKMLASFKVRIVLCLDGDEAGQLASVSGIRNLRTCGVPVQDVYVVALPNGKDPADIIAADVEEFTALIHPDKQVPLIRFLIERFADTSDQSVGLKSMAVARVAPFIRELPDPIERDAYLTMLAQRLGVSRQAVDEAVGERKPLEGVPVPFLLPLGRSAPPVASRSIPQVDRELYLLGLFVGGPPSVANFTHLGHQNLFGDLHRACLWSNLKDKLRYFPQLDTPEKRIDDFAMLDEQYTLREALAEVRRYPHTGDDWVTAIASTVELLKKQRSVEYKDFILKRINAAIEAGDKDEAKKLVDALAIGWQM